MSSITERRANGGISALGPRWPLSRSGVAVVTGRWRPVHCQEAKMKKSSIRKPAAPKPISQSASQTKLNESERNILASTLLREDGVALRPASMMQRAAHKLAAALIEKGLAREIRTKTGMPEWRHDDRLAYSLVVTKLGRSAIQESGEPLSDQADDEAEGKATEAAGVPASTVATTRASTAFVPPPSSLSGRVPPRDGSKLANAISLLSSSQGVGLVDLISATSVARRTHRRHRPFARVCVRKRIQNGLQARDGQHASSSRAPGGGGCVGG
jgi:hypothetical protein